MREDDGVPPMEPGEIFDLIVKADEKLKYATAERTDRRRLQAIELLTQARDAAREIGNDALVQQAELRLTDLGEATG
jgi:hypothetical protein